MAVAKRPKSLSEEEFIAAAGQSEPVKPRKSISLKVPALMFENLNTEAKRRGISRNALIVMALSDAGYGD